VNVLGTISPMSGSVEPAVHRWTRAEYDELVSLGAFDDRRIELLDGELIDMAPTSNRHWRVVTDLHNLLNNALDPSRFKVGSQGPFALSDVSEPEPDVVVMRVRTDLLVHDHAQPADLALVVEVCLSSWRYDSGIKLTAYARGRLPEVWLVDLNHDLVHVCRQPIDDIYTERFTVAIGGTLTIPEADTTVNVADFLV
jgi:Uma2 family endonuclease